MTAANQPEPPPKDQGIKPRADLVIVHAASLCRIQDHGEPRRGPAQHELDIIHDGALAVADGRIIAVGATGDVLAACNAAGAEVYDAGGQTVLPGLVEAHSHPVFAGSRYLEYAQRLSGVSLQEVVASGGGIWNSVLRTRAATDEELLEHTVRAFGRMAADGITTVEAKSGYGLTPHEWALDPSYKGVQYDAAKVKEKLAEGGRPNGFEFTQWIAAGNALGQQLAELMQAQLARNGIKMNIEAADFNGVVIPKAKAQEPGAFGISFSCGLDPDPCVDARFRAGSSFNYMGYDNPKVNELIVAAKRTNNREERAKLYKQIVPLITEDAPAVFTVYGLGRYVGNKRVQNWSVPGLPRLGAGYSDWWLSQ